MPIGTVRGNFTFAELESKVNGKYNRGELRLDADGKLHRLNNHVWTQLFNNKTTDYQANINVREAIYNSISARFGGSEGVTQYLKVAQEALIGIGNIGKPISRDEVRAIIAQLKAVEGKDAQNAEKALSDANRELKSAQDRLARYEKMITEMKPDEELGPANIEEERRDVTRLENRCNAAENEFNAAKQNFELALGQLSNPGELKDTVEDLVALREESGLSGKNTSEMDSRIRAREQSVERCLQEIGTEVSDQVTSLRNAISKYGSAARKSGVARHEFTVAERCLVKDSEMVSRKLRIDALVQENAELLRRAETSNPAEAAGLRERIAANGREVARLRKEHGITDERAGGMLTEADVERVKGLKRQAEMDVEAAKARVAAAESRFRDAQPYNLASADFSALLKTIRSIKEGVAQVEDMPDGGLKSSDAYRGFDRNIVLSGLRSGMGRSKILKTATVNSSRAARARRAEPAKPSALVERENRLNDFGRLANTLQPQLTEGLKNATSCLEQCRETWRIVHGWLRKMRDESEIDGLGPLLDQSIMSIMFGVTDFLDEAEKAGDKPCMKNDYRRILELTVEHLSVSGYAADPALATARELLKSKIEKMLFGRLEPSAVQQEPEQFSDLDSAFFTSVSRALSEKKIFQDNPVTTEDFRKLSAEAAKVLADTFAKLNVTGKPSFSDVLVDKVSSGDLSFDEFAYKFADEFRSSESYPPAGPLRDNCEQLLEAMTTASTLFDRFFV